MIALWFTVYVLFFSPVSFTLRRHMVNKGHYHLARTLIRVLVASSHHLIRCVVLCVKCTLIV